MKRSEAEKIINDRLDQSNEITGKTIIDLVQELGMLPPASKLKHLDKIDNSWEDE